MPCVRAGLNCCVAAMRLPMLPAWRESRVDWKPVHAPSEPSRKHAPVMLALASLGVAALVGLLAWIAWAGATDQTLLLVDAASR